MIMNMVRMRNLEKIGEGAYGAVYRCLSEGGKNNYAIKKGKSENMLRESEFLKKLNHHNVIKIFDYQDSADKTLGYLLMDFMPDGDLGDILHRYWNRRDGLGIYTYTFAFQLFKGLAYLEMMLPHPIVHRDLKPGNLLIDYARGILKIADFGCAEFLKENKEMITFVGTRKYMAPELIVSRKTRGKYNTTVDMWSSGCVIYNMVTNHSLFNVKNAEPNKARDKLRLLEPILDLAGPPSSEDIEGLSPIDQQCLELLIENKGMASSSSDISSQLDPDSTSKYSILILRNNLKRLLIKNAAKSLRRDSTLDLLINILKWNPKKRIKPMVACVHDWFKVILFHEMVEYPDGTFGPLKPHNLFEFSKRELSGAPTYVKKTLMKVHNFHIRANSTDNT